jgi:hypothetical protein
MELERRAAARRGDIALGRILRCTIILIIMGLGSL